MDVAEVKSRDYPPRLYPEGSSNLENKDINHNFCPRLFLHIRETIRLDVWEELVNSPIGIVSRLAGRESIWSGRTVHYLLCRQLRVRKKEMIWCLVVDETIMFSLLGFGEITGLNTCPLSTENFEIITTPLITLQQTYTNNVLFTSMNLYKHKCNDITKSSIKLDLLYLVTATPLTYIAPAIPEETHQ